MAFPYYTIYTFLKDLLRLKVGYDKYNQPHYVDFYPIQDFVCDFQMDFCQFEIKTRTYLNELDNLFKNGSQYTLKNKFDDFNKFMVGHMLQSCGKVKYYLERYFSYKYASCLPRVTIKIPYYHGDYIQDFYRSDSDVKECFLASNNSAFKDILEYGQYYISNNVPLDVKKSRYDNLRINNNLVNEYKLPNFVNMWLMHKFISQPDCDTKWSRCWYKYSTFSDTDEARPQSVYKSLLVIPMTIKSAQISDELNDGLGLNMNMYDPNRTKKLMFGFLCIDHPHHDYFNIDIDPRVGYIYADLLSYYFIKRSESINTSIYNNIYRYFDN